MWKYLKRYWVYFILAPILMLGEVLVDLWQPQMMSIIVDDGVLGLSNGGVGDISIILATGGIMLLLILGGVFCGIACGVCANIASMRFANDLRKDVYDSVMSLSFQQTEQFSTGSLVTRITNDITQLQNLVSQCVRGMVRNLVFFVGGIICMMMLHLSFGILVLCALPVLLVGVFFLISRITPLFSVMQKRLDRVNSVMQENVTGARVVKAYVREDYEEQRFGRANGDLVETQLRILVLISYLSPILNIVLNLSVIAVIWIGAIQVTEGTVTPGNVMAAITYLSQILGSAMMFANIFQQFSRGMASYRRIWEVLDCEPAIQDGGDAALPGTKEAGTGAGEKGLGIVFDHVSFSYPSGSGQRVLDDICLTIKPGETLGIMGETGSGKSTLVNLIPRFYEVTEGSVQVQGKDVRDYNLEELRSKMAIALQKSELFSVSIGENIRWGREDATEEEIRKATDAAQASEFIFEKEEGLDTQVAEKGMSLSGGQKQRLSISRALLKNAGILIFDDATSALDLKTEARLYQALNGDYKDVTKLIIAQRVASVKGADRIAVLENGRLVACDTHEKLLQECPQYQDIYHSQLREEDQMGGDR